MVETVNVTDVKESNPSLEEQSQQQENQEQAKQNGDRPEWLPEKFANAEDLAKAYGELETKFSSDETPPEAQTQDEVEKATGLNLDNYYNEFAEKGELSPESFSALEELGLSKDVVESYINGQNAMVDNFTQSIYDEVGGEAEYQKLIGWATENLSQAEQDAYNNALEGDIESAKLTLKGIQARAGSTNSSEPQLTQGQATQGRTDVFNSSAEVVQAINDKRYQEDTHYRSQVEQKLARSKVF